MMKRRRLLITGVLLLGGAIVNVAVAWGCCLPGMPLRETRVAPSEIRRIMAEQRVIDWRSSTQATYGKSFGQTAIQLDDQDSIAFRISAGIPCASVEGDYGFQWNHLVTFSNDPDEICRDWTWVLKRPDFNNELLRRHMRQGTWSALPNSVILPFGPIWPGFAINTIFYAAMLWGGWVVFFVPGMVRRRIRRRRGLCPACAYPTGGGTSPVCTECGKTVNEQELVKD